MKKPSPINLRIKNLPSYIKIFSLMLIIFISACNPQSKESYMKDYKEFINTVNEKSGNYTENDWVNADEKFNKFNNEWYDKFKDDFTLTDKLKLGKYSLQYGYAKLKNNSKTDIDIFSNVNYKELKNQIKDLYDNDLQKDIKKIVKQAKTNGDSLSTMIKEILNELNIEIEE